MCQHAMHRSWNLEDPAPMQVSWSGAHLHAGTLLRRTPVHRPCHPRVPLFIQGPVDPVTEMSYCP